MHSIKEDTVQTYPIRNSKKHKQYAFPIVVLAVTALPISTVCSLVIPDPLETLSNSIRKRTTNSDKKTDAKGNLK